MDARMEEYPSTGFEPMDAEHRQVTQRIRDVVEAINRGDEALCYARMVTFIAASRAHFAHEEALMVQARYPLYERHKVAHDHFIKDTQAHTLKLTHGGLTPEFRRWALQRMATWFQMHIKANDVALGHFLLDASRLQGAA